MSKAQQDGADLRRKIVRTSALAGLLVTFGAIVLFRLGYWDPPPPSAEESLRRVLDIRESPKARRSAIGDLSGYSSNDQRALDPEGFSIIDEPKGLDWLVAHYESGQSFEAYRSSGPNLVDATRATLYLLPLGDFGVRGDEDLAVFESFTRAYFAMPVVTLPALDVAGLRVSSRPARDHEGRQLQAAELLDRLTSRLPEDAYCLLAITLEDLYPDPKWNFVFGLASLRERVGVFSFLRFKPAFYGDADSTPGHRTFRQRACKTLAHEAGHMFGIHHCIYFNCVMNGSNHLRESDRHPFHLCPVDLRKLVHAAGLEIDDRYRALADWYQRQGWNEEAQWIRSRLQ